ncbi:aldehyde dehydrogenase family protein [Nocardia sp. NPDC127579]|uniref:aldehyde dehydrogenase family protein n=1 Tax=Nocardia sp. NPDC127579 TaxID=3345402 RepID=UPI00363139D3
MPTTARFQAHNPYDGTPGPWHPESAPEAIAEATRNASKAFRAWRGTDPTGLLLEIATRLAAVGDELIDTADGETGIGPDRLAGELDRTVYQLRSYAEQASEYLDTVRDKPRGTTPDLRRTNIPVGPVAIFTASNFPFAFGVAGTDTAAALAVGCPVVVKGHPLHPATNALTARLITEAVAAVGAPAGVFALVQGKTIETGAALVTAPEVAAVAFTGSFGGGRALHELAAARPRPIPVYAEMGSLNPVYLSPATVSSLRDQTVADFVTSATALNGQLCTNPGLVFVPTGADGDQWIAEVVARMSTIEPATMLSEGMRTALSRAIATVKQLPDVRIRLEGRSGKGFRQSPTVVETDVPGFLAGAVLREEHFGPFTALVRYHDTSELLTAAEALEPALTATIHALPSESDWTAAVCRHAELSSGRVIFDGWPTGVAVSAAQHHGGPWPATSSAAHTSVGPAAVRRFLRPLAYQNAPTDQLPPYLGDPQ